MPCVPKKGSPGFFVVGLFTYESQKTILMVILFAVDRPSLIGSHSQITFNAPYGTFGLHGTSFGPSALAVSLGNGCENVNSSVPFSDLLRR